MARTLIKYSLLLLSLQILAGCGPAPEPTVLEGWGLGREESRYVSLNRDYDWYVDQYEERLGHQYNDGPACAVMAAKWADADFPQSLTHARETYMNNKLGYIGRWKFGDIYNYLSANDIPCQFDYCISLPYLVEHLDNGNILIVYITTWSIILNKKEEQRTGKYYSSFSGRRVNITAARASSRHFIILKGYRIVDGKTYFEVYDPFGAWRYDDGTHKGQDRYYLADEVINGMENVDAFYGSENIDHFLVISTRK
jgi:hypothetical protein